MKNSNLVSDYFQDKEAALQTLVEGSDKNDLAQCVRMISLYVSIYKKYYGELPEEIYGELFINNEVCNESEDIFFLSTKKFLIPK